MSNLRENSFWSIISVGSYAAAQWWILSFMARQGKIDQIGFYSIALSVTTPLVVFSNLNLRYLYVSDNRTNFEFSDYINLRKIMILTMQMLICIVAFFSDYNRYTKLLIVSVGLYKLIESVSDIYFAFHQKSENMKMITKSVLIRSLLIFVTFSLCFYLTGDILICALFIICIYLTTLLSIDIPSIKPKLYSSTISFTKLFKSGDHTQNLIRLFKVGFPMGASMMVYAAIIAIPRFFIEKNIGIAQLGIYTALYYLYSAILLVAIALADAALPRFTSYEQNNDQFAFWSLLRKYIFGTVVVICFGATFFWYFGSQFLKLVYGSLFAAYSKIFILGLFVTGIEIINKFLSICMTAKRILVLQPFLNLMSFVNLGIICIFIGKNITLYSILAAQGIIFGIQMILTIIILTKWKKKSVYESVKVCY